MADHTDQHISWDVWDVAKEAQDREYKALLRRLELIERKYNTMILLMVANLVAIIVSLIKGAL